MRFLLVISCYFCLVTDDWTLAVRNGGDTFSQEVIEPHDLSQEVIEPHDLSQEVVEDFHDGLSQEVIDEQESGESQEIIEENGGKKAIEEGEKTTTTDPRLSTAAPPLPPYPYIKNEFTCILKNVEECRENCKSKLPDEKRDEVMRCLLMGTTVITKLKECVNGKTLPDPHDCVQFRFSKAKKNNDNNNCAEQNKNGAAAKTASDEEQRIDRGQKVNGSDGDCNTQQRRPSIYDDLREYFYCENECRKKQPMCDQECKENTVTDQNTLDSCSDDVQEKTGVKPFQCLKEAMGGKTRGGTRGRRAISRPSERAPSWLKAAFFNF